MDSRWPTLTPTARPWLRLAAWLLGLALLIWAVVDLRPVLTPIVVALALAYVLSPVVGLLERRGVSRLVAVIGLYVVGAALTLSLGLFLTVKTFEQAARLRDQAVSLTRSARDWWTVSQSRPADATVAATADELAQRAAQSQPAPWWQEITPLIERHGLAIANSTLTFLTGLFADLAAWLSVFVLIPLFTFFFLWRFNDILRAIRDHLPAGSRDTIVHLATTIDQAMANFFRGKLIVCLIVGLVTGLGWTLIGIPYSVPLGALVGVLNLVPFLSLLALPPALLSSYLGAFEAHEDWKAPVILTMGVFMLVQALESFMLTPAVQARSSGLHPLTAVTALLIGGHWAGFMGLLLAIPIASTLKALATEFVLPELRRAAAEPAVPTDPCAAGSAPPIPPEAAESARRDGAGALARSSPRNDPETPASSEGPSR